MPEKEKKVRGDRLWRGAALLLLCALVYYVSYDHGRQSVRLQLDGFRREAASELDNQARELRRLQAALAECQVQTASSSPSPSLDRIPLKVNQSRVLFGGRLVLTLVKVESEEHRALIQLNFIEEERLVSEVLSAGGSLRFSLDGQRWAVVVSALSLSAATLNLVELKDQ